MLSSIRGIADTSLTGYIVAMNIAVMSALTRWLAKVSRDPRRRRLLTVTFADSLGTGLFLPLSVIYLTRIVGLSPARAGLGLTIACFFAIAAPVLSGALLARFDARKIVVGCFAASAAGFAAYTVVDSFASFLVVAIVIQFASRMYRPATLMLTIGVTPRAEQLDTLALRQSLSNLGYVIGGILAALAPLPTARPRLWCCSRRMPPPRCGRPASPSTACGRPFRTQGRRDRRVPAGAA